MLAQVADYQAPTAQLPGLYRLKPEAWLEFEPFFLHLSRSHLQVTLASLRDLVLGAAFQALRPNRRALKPLRRHEYPLGRLRGGLPSLASEARSAGNVAPQYEGI